MHPLLEQKAADVGGASNLAKIIGVTRQALFQWDRVPAERVLQVERTTGISRHDLRPDLYPREAA